MRIPAQADRAVLRDGLRSVELTQRLPTARSWLAGGGDGDLDGVVAKRLDEPYRSGEREGMVKVKRERSADCVVGGFRYASKGGGVGSLLLGLYDPAGKLDHVGFCSNLSAEEERGLKAKLVVEVQYDHVSNGRFRHGTRFLRWRPDKAPRQCTMEQLR